jgi:hypothetical protein
MSLVVGHMIRNPYVGAGYMNFLLVTTMNCSLSAVQRPKFLSTVHRSGDDPCCKCDNILWSMISCYYPS